MAGLIQFTNNAATLLASSITSIATSLTVSTATGSLFPTLAGGQYFYCTLTNAAATVIEIVKVTARSTDTFTIVRAQDGTSASAFSAGEKVELRLVAVELQNFPQLDSTNTFAAAQTFSAGITSTVTPVGVTSGGTGLGTLTANNVILGAGTSTPTFVAPSTSGNLLTSNGTTWTSSTPATPNVAGGATTTSQGTSLTLTSASNRVQNVTFTATNLSLTLPDATTLSAGGPTFIISNTGVQTFSVKANGGAVLTALTSGQSVELRLVDITTAAGKWNISNTNISIYPPATQFAASQIDSNAIFMYLSGSLQNQNGTRIDCLKLTSTTAILVWTRNSNTSVYGCVVTNTSGTLSYGTTVQIYDGSAGGTAAVTSAHTSLFSGLATGLVFVARSATSVAIPFSISGTTITVGTTSATFGVTSSGTAVNGHCNLSSTVKLIAYSTAGTTSVLNTITYNGASAPTLGTASTAITVISTGSYSPLIGLGNLTATTSFAIYMSASSTVATRVITTSGVTAPTLGTVLSQTISMGSGRGSYYNSGIGQVYVYSSTEVGAVYSGDADKIAFTASYTISGTTVTAQTVPTIPSAYNSYNTSQLINISTAISWFSSTDGLFINTLDGVSIYTLNTSPTICKINYTTGASLIPSGATTLALPTYSVLTNVCALSATTGIAVGIASDNTAYANAININ